MDKRDWKEMKRVANQNQDEGPPGCVYRIDTAKADACLQKEAHENGARLVLWCGYVYAQFDN